MRRYIEERLGYKPRVCVWELTLACNSRCLHCGSFAGRPREDELDTKEALDLVRQLRELGCERISLSGGEPLLRKDWHVIGEAIVKEGMAAGMISNGLAFDREAARAAAGFGIEGVSFSIDGLEPTHERTRTIPRSFSRVMKAVETALAENIPVCCVTHVNKWNIRELTAMHRMLREAGVCTWKVQLSNPAGEMAACRDLVLQPEDLLHLLPALWDLRTSGLPFLEISDSIGYYGSYERLLRKTWRKELPFWMGCNAGMRAIGVESNGNIKGCLALPSKRHGSTQFLEGNIRLTSLAEIWNNPEGFAYNRRFTVDQLEGFCRTCQYAEICRGGCRWTALSNCGTYLENRYCYHRVWTLSGKKEKGLGSWLPSCIAPAFLMATLGFGGCYASSGNSFRDDAAETQGEDVIDARQEAIDVRDAPPETADLPPEAAQDIQDMQDIQDVRSDEQPPYCPTSRDQLCCFVCDGRTMWRGSSTCEAVEASCSDDYAGPVPIPADCLDPCCPTAEEVCCMCDYMGPGPVPPQCPDPCEPPNDSLYSDAPPFPVPGDGGEEGGGK
jgi:radical SAM protein with 4Fe4S-binding SPASM domain